MNSFKFRHIVIRFTFVFIYSFFIALNMSYAEKPSIESGNNATEDKKDNIDEIQSEIKKINERIKMIQAVQSEQVAEEFGVKVTDIETRLLDLGVLESSYKRLLLSTTTLNKLEKDKLSIKEKYENFHAKGMAESAPYTLTFLDSIYEELSTAESSQKNIHLTIEMLRQEIIEHNEKVKNLEKELRRNEEILENAVGNAKKYARWQVNEDTIRLAYHRTIIQAKNNEIRRYELEKNLIALQIALFKEQTSYVKSNVAYNEQDLKHHIETIQQKKTEIQKENRLLLKEQKNAEKKWLKAQQNLEKELSGDLRTIAETSLKSKSKWRETYQVASELNEKALLLMDQKILAWQKRYALVKGDLSLDKLKEMKLEIRNDLDSLDQALQIQQNYLADLQNQMRSLEVRIDEEGGSEPIRRHLSAQLNALRKQLTHRLAYQSAILAVDHIKKRLHGEIEETLGQLSIKDHITDIKEDIADFWNIEIWTVDKQPVTLRKVAIALAILLVGIVFTNLILSIIRNRFLLKSQFKETTASAVHKILSYTAYLMICLFALRMVNIPLTAFAFLGGAVAIGIGFGAQNLINNFISGFMILGERPINIGDLIEIEGVLGMVEEIGARCTRVRTGENIRILVPNSTFLEKNITNWTLSDKKIRTSVAIGVTYGSPVKVVENKLIQAVKQVKHILGHPEPFVLFSDFGDNALIFHVYFWISIKRIIERRQIESKVRFKIDELFTKEGIVIAFPQRDVHLDTIALEKRQ